MPKKKFWSDHQIRKRSGEYNLQTLVEAIDWLAFFPKSYTLRKPFQCSGTIHSNQIKIKLFCEWKFIISVLNILVLVVVYTLPSLLQCDVFRAKGLLSTILLARIVRVSSAFCSTFFIYSFHSLLLYFAEFIEIKKN